ncbi:OmpA family protein [Candidatus Omnitrophota bacterium]
MKGKLFILVVLGLSACFLSGCSLFMVKDSAKLENLELEISYLKGQLEKTTKEKDSALDELRTQKTQEVRDLERAKAELERSLMKEIGEYKAKLEMTERGLVITFLTEIFFDSGKDVIREEGQEALSKVAEVLNANVPNSLVAIEGHTDNEPIKYSGWKTNWELSSARALSVLHYLIDKAEVAPERLSANGYGEYRPVASNETPEGMKKNRRVEIVILPEEIKKVKAEE